MLINIANAAELPFGLSNSAIGNFLPMILISVIFYFLVIRSHQTKLKKHKQMVDGIVSGDKVLTSSGMIGKVCQQANEQGEILVEIAKNVRVTMMSSCVSDVLRGDRDNFEPS